MGQVRYSSRPDADGVPKLRAHLVNKPPSKAKVVDPRHTALQRMAQRAAELGYRKPGKMCAFLGISMGTLQTWRKRGTGPDAVLLPGIARKLDVTVDWLLGVADDPLRELPIDVAEQVDNLLSAASELIRAHLVSRRVGERKRRSTDAESPCATPRD